MGVNLFGISNKEVGATHVSRSYKEVGVTNIGRSTADAEVTLVGRYKEDGEAGVGISSAEVVDVYIYTEAEEKKGENNVVPLLHSLWRGREFCRS